MIRDLEIIFIYRSNQGRETDYNTLKLGTDTIDSEDYDAENFWQTMGGIAITKDGYKTIFSSTGFYNIVKPINFILHSLYKIRNIRCNWFDEDEANPMQISVRTVANEALKLQLLDNNTLSLSFHPLTAETRHERGKHYFVDEIVEIETWVTEAETALSEYFTIFSKVVEESPENNTVRIMKEYLSIYTKICSNAAQ